jgi:excisionase family DNA binding protein
LRVSQTTIYNWLRDKTLDGMKIGARWRVVATALQPPTHENTSRLPNAASP